MSEFKHLQRCPWFNSPSHVNTRAHGWPQLGRGLEIVYNWKKPTEPSPYSLSKCFASLVSSCRKCWPPVPQKEKKTPEMILAGKMCWAQKMPCIYPAVRVWDGSGLKAENAQVQELPFSFNTKRFRQILLTFQACFSAVVKDCAQCRTCEWLCWYKIKVHEYKKDGLHSLLLYSQTVQLSSKPNLFLLIQRTTVFYGAGNYYNNITLWRLKPHYNQVQIPS